MNINQAKNKGINEVSTFVKTINIDIVFNDLKTNLMSFNNYTDLIISYVLECKFKNHSELINYSKTNNLNTLFVINSLKFLGLYTNLLDYFEAIKKDKTILVYNKQSKAFKEKYSFCFDVINEYYDNCLKMNINIELIISSEKIYSNGIKEGITIKKQPYNSIYTINVYGFNGGTLDITEKTLTDTKQKGFILYLNHLPNKNELIQIISLIPIFEKNKDYQITFNTDFKNNLIAYNVFKLNEILNTL